MKDATDVVQNPVIRYLACFDSVQAAARAAGITTEMLRRMRLRGYVTTRKRALEMARACAFQVSPTELMALPQTPADAVADALVGDD